MNFDEWFDSQFGDPDEIAGQRVSGAEMSENEEMSEPVMWQERHRLKAGGWSAWAQCGMRAADSSRSAGLFEYRPLFAALAHPPKAPEAPSAKPVGYVCKSDLSLLAREGACMLYEQEQYFKLLPPESQLPLYAHPPKAPVDHVECDNCGAYFFCGRCGSYKCEVVSAKAPEAPSPGSAFSDKQTYLGDEIQRAMNFAGLTEPQKSGVRVALAESALNRHMQSKSPPDGA